MSKSLSMKTLPERLILCIVLWVVVNPRLWNTPTHPKSSFPLMGKHLVGNVEFNAKQFLKWHLALGHFDVDNIAIMI